MAAVCMRLKLSSFVFFIFTLDAFAQVGLFATKNINYKEIIEFSSLSQKEIETKINCTPVVKSDLAGKKIIAKHYIPKGSVICTKSVEEYKKEAVKFDFGSFEIETEGKIIFENDEFVKIKKLDGSIEKIFKNGLDR